MLVGLAFVAVVLGLVALIVTTTTRDQLLDQVDQRLMGLDAPGRRAGPRWLPGGEGDDGLPPDYGSGEVYQASIADDTNRGVVWSNVRRDDEEVSPPALDGDIGIDGVRALLTVPSKDGSLTYRVLIERGDEVTVISAVPIDDVQRTISRLILVTLLGSVAILVALGVVAWWVVRLGVRPIKEMTITAGRIAEGDHDVRIPEQSAGTESGELAVALNRMVGSITDALDERTRSEERTRQFVADASHELRTPVTTIRGYAELYRHGGLAEPAALDDAMRRTEQEAARMGRLVEDMLALARLDERRTVERRPLDLTLLARDAAADAAAAGPDRPVTLTATSPVTVTGDEDRLRQVIANVVGNALVHTDDGVAIALRTGVDGDEAWFEVSDQGGGMTPAVVARVTERFFRADPARSRHRGGSGLGLSIVDAAVAAHGGRVEVSSEVGEGTTVRLIFPVARIAPAAPVTPVGAEDRVRGSAAW